MEHPIPDFDKAKSGYQPWFQAQTEGLNTRYVLSQHTVIKRTCLEAKKRPRNQEKPGRKETLFPCVWGK